MAHRGRRGLSSPPPSRRRSRGSSLILGLLLVACSEPAEPSAPTPPGPSILLITLDTVRADHLGCYGRELARTPNIDALASEGVRYECAQSVAPMTAPAHSSLFTGLYPPRHGVHENGRLVLPDEVQTLAESLREAGYRTGAAIASVVLDERYGFDQGFDHFSVPEAREALVGTYVCAEAEDVTRRARAFLDESDDRPFFLWVHYWDAHQPCVPPPKFRIPEGTDYDGEIQRVDHFVGELRAAAEARAPRGELMTVLTADHGEGFGFKGEPTHSYYTYGPMVRVPLIVRHADGRDAGAVRREVVSVVDVLPTVLGELGLEAAEPLDGLPLDDVAALERRAAVYVESAYPYFHHRWSPIAGLVGPDSRYFHSSQPELYRLAADELEGEVIEDADAMARHEQELRRILEGPRRVARAFAADAGTTASLEAMGYLTGATDRALPPLDEWAGLRSPSAFRPRIQTFFDATTPRPGWSKGRAIAQLRAMVAEDPGDLAALDHLARFLIEAGRYADAAEPLRALIAADPERSQALGNLGAVLQAAGRFDEALEVYQRTLDLDPKALNVLRNMIAILDHLERDDEADLYRELLSERGG